MRPENTDSLDPDMRLAPEPAEATLELVAERLTVERRERVTGRVRIRTVTETVEEIARVELAGETVEITRVPVGRAVDVAPEPRVEGEVTILPVLEEELVVTTRLVLREEIHIRRRPTRETVEIPVTLRRQRAIVERDGPAAGDAPNVPTQPSEDET